VCSGRHCKTTHSERMQGDTEFTPTGNGPPPSAQLAQFEDEEGWRYRLWVTNLPERTRTGAASWPASTPPTGARVEDAICTGKDIGIGMSVRQLAQNRAWLTTALTVSTVLSCRTWIKIRPEGLQPQRRFTVNTGELASTREEPRFTQSPCDG